MLCQIQDDIFDSLKSLKGELLQLCRYRHGDHTFDDGYVLSGASDYFFIEVKTKKISRGKDLHLLIIDQVWEDDLDDDINFEVIDEGELSEIHFFSHSLNDISIERKKIDKIISECAMIINFKDKTNHLIYPKEDLFGNSAMESDTDKVLDIFNLLKLSHSRSI